MLFNIVIVCIECGIKHTCCGLHLCTCMHMYAKNSTSLPCSALALASLHSCSDLLQVSICNVSMQNPHSRSLLAAVTLRQAGASGMSLQTLQVSSHIAWPLLPESASEGWALPRQSVCAHALARRQPSAGLESAPSLVPPKVAVDPLQRSTAALNHKSGVHLYTRAVYSRLDLMWQKFMHPTSKARS